MAIILTYWDSDCFLGWFNAEKDKVKKCRGTLVKAEEGDLKIVTSAITLTEVIKLKRKPRLKAQDEKKINDFFKHDYIVIRNLDRRVAEYARKLIWKYISLQPKDSIHLATAILNDIPTLNTFDEDLLKLQNRLGNINLRICEPDIPYQGGLGDILEK